jgi:hypothetical protein
MTPIMKYLLFVALIFSSLVGHSQSVAAKVQLLNSYLNQTQEIQEEVVTASTVVMVHTSPEALINSNWKVASQELHTYLAKLKIDAVAYFYIGDFYSGSESNPAFTQYLLDRDIKSLLLLDYFPKSEQEDYYVRLTTFNGKNTLVDIGQGSWQKKGDNLKEIITALGNDIIRKDLKQGNFLIADAPEFIEDVKVLDKRKFPVYTTDVRIEKLAVPYFDSIFVKDPKKVSASVLAEINLYNAEIAQSNRELEQIMSTYPYEYSLVKYSEESRFYFMNGFQFILVNLHSRGSVLKNMLDFERADNLTHLVTVTNGANPITTKIPYKMPVYKYYIRHSISGNVYVGDFWDTATTWQEALRIFINNVAYNAK